MTNHPNRGWRSRWTVDRTAREARHVSGLVVRFGEMVGGSADGEVVDGTVGGLDAARLMREAGEIYVEALRDGA